MSKTSNMKIQVLIVSVTLMLCILIIGLYEEDKGDRDIVLSEICSYNDTIIYNSIGKYYDYIEIYNPTSKEMDIGGYSLSDEKDNLTKYVFPKNTIINSGEYVLVWAATWTEEKAEGADRYTGFSLKAGETLYLSNDKGRVIEKVTLPASIDRDVSYSRNGDEWLLAEASPLEENHNILPEEKEYLTAELEFSRASGFYDEPFYLEINTNGNYEIYYTLDGSVPTSESIKYKEPVYIYDATENSNVYSTINPEEITLTDWEYIPTYNVDKATIIRAVAVDESGVVSRDISATYFVGFQEKESYKKVSTISIITDPKNLFDYKRGIYVTGEIWDINKESRMWLSDTWRVSSPTNYMGEGKGWRREGVVLYFDSSQKLVYDQRVDIGMHGSTSLSNVQKGFNLYAKPESDGKTYVFEGLFDEKETSLMLRTGGVDWNRTKIRDALVQETVSDRELITLKYEPCQVFIDGEYWGVYMLQERCTESMIASKIPIESENIILLKDDNIVAGDEEDIELWQAVLDFAKENDLSLQKNYEKMEQLIDIQSLIDHYCFQIYVVNMDSFKNNYVRWRAKNPDDSMYGDGKWRWIVCDIDCATGWAISEEINPATIDSFIEGNWNVRILDEVLFSALIKNEEFKARFVTTFMDMANYNFEAGKMSERLDEIAEQQGEAMVAFQKRFCDDAYRLEDYLEQIDVLKSFFSERYDYITGYMKSDLELQGELVNVTVKNSAGGQVKVNTLTIGAEEFSGKYYSDYDIVLSAEATEGYEFKGWDINGMRNVQQSVVLELDKEYVIVPYWEKVR